MGPATTRAPLPELRGLVVAGGASRRMEQDKGLIDYGGETAVARAVRVVLAVCPGCYVSIRPEQAMLRGYAEFDLIADRTTGIGPMASLLAAWERFPDAAWMTLAVDMPLVDADLLSELVKERDPAAVATAYVNETGVPEPLCAIWEPAAHTLLAGRCRAGRHSLRDNLIAGDAKLIVAGDPRKLVSTNTPADVARLAPYVK